MTMLAGKVGEMDCIGGVTLPPPSQRKESFIRLFSFEKTSPETKILEEEIAILCLKDSICLLVLQLNFTL